VTRKKAKPRKLKRQQILKGRRDWDAAKLITDNFMKQLGEATQQVEPALTDKLEEKS
jgi:hypothetical protein